MCSPVCAGVFALRLRLEFISPPGFTFRQECMTKERLTMRLFQREMNDIF